VVQSAGAWKATNFATKKLLDFLKDKTDAWKVGVFDMCPSDQTVGIAGATWTIPLNMICRHIVYIVWKVFKILASKTKVVRTSTNHFILVCFVITNVVFFPILV
jgi:hypothetical protein